MTSICELPRPQASKGRCRSPPPSPHLDYWGPSKTRYSFCQGCNGILSLSDAGTHAQLDTRAALNAHVGVRYFNACGPPASSRAHAATLLRISRSLTVPPPYDKGVHCDTVVVHSTHK